MQQTLITQLENIYQLHILECACESAINKMQNYGNDIKEKYLTSSNIYAKPIDVSHIQKPIQPSPPIQPQLVLEKTIDLPSRPKKYSAVTITVICLLVVAFVIFLLSQIMPLSDIFSGLKSFLWALLIPLWAIAVFLLLFVIFGFPFFLSQIAAVVIFICEFVSFIVIFPFYILLNPQKIADFFHDRINDIKSNRKKMLEYEETIKKNDEISIENERRKAEYEKQMTIYNTQKSQYDQLMKEYQIKLIEYEQEIANVSKKRAHEQLQIIENFIQRWSSDLSLIRERLHCVYQEIGIHEYYRTPVACALFLQYLQSDRCTDLDKAYNIYDTERRLGHIVTSIDNIITYYNSKDTRHDVTKNNIIKYQENVVPMIQSITSKANRLYERGIDYLNNQ